jgi:acetyltransferase
MVEDWKSDLSSFFNPQSIAIVGASEVAGSFTNVAYEYLVHFGFAGAIYPVNPKWEKVWGLPCFKTVKEIDRPVDQAIVAVEARMVPGILRDCGQKGIHNAVIFSSGFAEVGDEEGFSLQKDLVSVAEEYHIKIGGPNCVGFASIKSNTVCYSAPIPPTIPKGRVGYVSQSATMAANVLSAGISNGIGFTYVVSSGNEAVLGFTDYIEFMLQDPEITVVAAFVEGVRDAQKFFQVADLAARLGKPFLILKIGKSEKGRQAAASHTGSMTGTYAVYQAVFKQKGVILVDTIEQMVESIKLLSYRKPVKKKGIAIISGSGGVCGYISDRSEEIGLPILDFSPATEARLKELMPTFGTVHNPLDITGQSRTEPDLVSNASRVLLEDDSIGILIFGLGLTTSVLSPYITPILIKYIETGQIFPEKLLAFLSCNTESFTPAMKEFVDTYQVPILQGGRVGLKAIKDLLEYSSFIDRQKEAREGRSPVIAPQVTQSWRHRLSINKGRVSEKEAKDLLEDYGIRVPRRSVVSNLQEAKEAAVKIGYPVVLKIQSCKIMHKTEAGGVKLNLSNEKMVSRAFSDLENLARRIGSSEGFLLEEMVHPGIEMILGMKRDDLFGPVIMFGLGGIFTEVFKDVTLRLPPINPREAMGMIQEIRGAKLLNGFRGNPKGDVDALIDAISRMSRLAQDLSEVISQIDINPLVVLEEGSGVVALDALFVPGEPV